MIHGSAESSSHLENQNIIYNTPVTRAWLVLTLSLELSLYARHKIVCSCLPTLLPL